MGLRARRVGGPGATKEHIREKSVTEEQRRQPACPPRARAPQDRLEYFSDTLSDFLANPNAARGYAPGGVLLLFCLDIRHSRAKIRLPKTASIFFVPGVECHRALESGT